MKKVTRKWKVFGICGLVAVVGLLIAGGIGYHHQATRFNAHITINQIEVGGLTARQALNKLKAVELKNVVYLGDDQVYDGIDTKASYTDNDLPNVKKIVKQQRTFFPSSKPRNFDLTPSMPDSAQIQSVEQGLRETLTSLNKTLPAPQDAAAHIEDGRMIITPSKAGQQYDIEGVIKEYENQAYNSIIHLQPLYLQPVTVADPVIKQERDKLQELVSRKVDYNVQDKVYSFHGSSIIKSASVSKDMKVEMALDESEIKKKLDAINDTQSTLNKNYAFTTHSGSVISVKGESYGWALNVDAESTRIEDAFEKGTASISAYNVYGVGWNINGVGYHTTGNHGIGDTYVEVSIEDQKIWVYKEGKLEVTTNVVTGTHIYNEDTPKGVWYIEYKQSPSVLRGSEVGNENYAVKVKYWAPFTLSGCGFHDASWRGNWASDAYLKYGSGGCVNTPPKVMKSVYDHLTQYEPVVIY